MAAIDVMGLILSFLRICMSMVAIVLTLFCHNFDYFCGCILFISVLSLLS